MAERQSAASAKSYKQLSDMIVLALSRYNRLFRHRDAGVQALFRIVKGSSFQK